MAIVLLIILYTLTFIVLISRLTRSSVIRLTRKEIAIAFAFKVAMGVLYGFVFKEFYGGDDTWKYFNESLNEYNKLLFQTQQFFKEIIPLDSFQKYPSFADNFRDFLENLELNAVTKSLAVFNVLSFQNYYADVVFFNLFSFVGSYLLFKLFTQYWTEKRLLVYIAAFFIPSISFWLSGIRSDAFLLLSIAVVLYYFHAWFYGGRFIYLLLFLLGLVGTFVFRMQFFMVLMPFLVAWGISMRYPKKSGIVFASVFVLSLIIFFGSIVISPQTNLASVVVEKQHEFLGLKGNTVFALNRLEPTVKSFASTLPQAALNSFLRPFPWEAKGALQIAAAAEIIFFWAIVLFAIRNYTSIPNKPLTWFTLFFCICTYLLIGYTVPFPGAIVRYKTIPELLIFLLLLPALPIKLKKIYI